MKIDPNVVRADTESFMVHEHLIGSTPVLLCQPTHIGARWDRDNLIFRSSVWTTDGRPVSLSWKKFANYGEKPDLFRVPSSLDGAEAMEKIDGSTLIVSTFEEDSGRSHLVIRTRGTVDATRQENGFEIETLKHRYPLAFGNSVVQSGEASVVFEWTSPTNRVVLDYGPEPLLYLTGIISHDSYRYTSQATLDYLAKQWGVLRPRRYTFKSMNELQIAVEAFRGVEGVCLYFNDGQEITKLKGAEYLFLHRAKSDISSVEKVIDLWFDQDQPAYQEFFDFLTDAFDYEIAVMARGHVSRICDAWKDVEKIIHGLNNFVTPLLLNNASRKDAAAAILQAYGSTGRSAMCFTLLDRKPLSNDQKKKLLYQKLKD